MILKRLTPILTRGLGGLVLLSVLIVPLLIAPSLPRAHAAGSSIRVNVNGATGGFAMTETVRDQRDWVTNVTTLSGDIGAPGNNADNSYHVVNGSGVTNTAVLDGFIVTQGNANGSSPNDSGGGMYNEGGSPTVWNSLFSANSATKGGGMYNEGGSPTVRNTIFSSSLAYAYGGGMYNSNNNPTLIKVTFEANSAGLDGGGMYNSNNDPTLTDVTFSANSATEGNGGGMSNRDSTATLTNITFSANSAYAGGGGMNNDRGTAALINVTFDANSTFGFADRSDLALAALSPTASLCCNGGGMANWYGNVTVTNATVSANSASYSSGGLYNYYGTLTVRNSILWGNAAKFDGQINGTATISDSVVQGGYPGGSNIITADPHLGPLGDYGGRTPTIPLLYGSSAVDAVDAAQCPATDQRGVPRPQGAACDLGAFEAYIFRLAYLPIMRR